MISSPRPAIALAFTAVVALTASSQVEAFATSSRYQTSTSTSTVLHEQQTDSSLSSSSTTPSRRSFLSTLTAASFATLATTTATTLPANAADTKESLIADLSDSLVKIRTIPPLLESAEWDKVRTTLKTPPVNQLWNLGESQNTLVKLAKETGEFEIMEIKDELAIALQMTDQYSYDNNFIYYQPGNGKLHTKEPLEMAKKAITQLQEALDVVQSS